MAGSRVIVVVDDTILRLLQVTLDPETPPERHAAKKFGSTTPNIDIAACEARARRILPSRPK